jgi:hypothetical protein
VPIPTAVLATTFICDNIIAQTNGDMTALGSRGNVRSVSGVVGDSFCRIIARNGAFVTSASEIGLPQILDLGVVHSVNVFGFLPGGVPETRFASPVRLCMRGSGDVLFVASGNASRLVTRLQSAPGVAGFVCVDVPSAGLVTMVSRSSGAPITGSGVVPPVAGGEETALNACTVTTLAIVNLRSGASTNSTVAALVPFNTRLQASARVPGWYRVNYLGTNGFISEQFLTFEGACGR